jgi:hypothetical protein
MRRTKISTAGRPTMVIVHWACEARGHVPLLQHRRLWAGSAELRQRPARRALQWGDDVVRWGTLC